VRIFCARCIVGRKPISVMVFGVQYPDDSDRSG
jgi:hypothetical protein